MSWARVAIAKSEKEIRARNEELQKGLEKLAR
jgi:hypothetical protein